MTDEGTNPFRNLDIDVINEQLNGHIEEERSVVIDMSGVWNENNAVNQMFEQISLPFATSPEPRQVPIIRITPPPSMEPTMLPTIPPPPPPPAPPVLTTAQTQTGSSGNANNSAWGASFNTVGLIQRVLRERRSVSSGTEVDPDENYVNFDDLQDVKITLKQSAIKKLPMIIDFSKISTCMICWDSIMDEAIELPCNHYFHEECIKTWLSEFSYICPICKKPAGEKETHL